MKSENQIRKYIQEFLEGLSLGTVYQDRVTMDDTTKSKNTRTYIFFDLPEGVVDQGPWFSYQCVVAIGCRDKVRGRYYAEVLDSAVETFVSMFEKDGHKDTFDDRTNGISFIDMECGGLSPYGIDNHEYQFVFEVIAEKG